MKKQPIKWLTNAAKQNTYLTNTLFRYQSGIITFPGSFYKIASTVGMGDYENMIQRLLSVQVSRLLATLHMYVDFIQQSN